MPTDALKRIEEKHRLMMVEGGAFCEACRLPDQGLPCYRLRPHPCDVVKLARALDEAVKQIHTATTAWSGGYSEEEILRAGGLSKLHHLRLLREKGVGAQRTLEEVSK